MSKIHKYDLIFSLGEACSCSELLRKNGLQIKAYPFDWLFGSDFVGRCKILAERLASFIEKKDLEFSFEERNIHCKAYHNKLTDLTFNHDFHKDIPFEEMYPQVKEKYERRITRLLKEIENAQKILIVYLETPITNHAKIEEKDIVAGFAYIQQAYAGKDIHLMYIRNERNSVLQEKQLTKDIKLISCDYKAGPPQLDYVVCFSTLDKILKNYRLNLPLTKKLKISCLRLTARLIPNKQMRKNVRKKWHIYRK